MKVTSRVTITSASSGIHILYTVTSLYPTRYPMWALGSNFSASVPTYLDFKGQ